MKRYLLIIFLLIHQISFSQKVYVTHNREEADLLVYRVKYFSEAHLVVKKTRDFFDLEKKFHWYFVTSKMAADPGWTIYYTKKREEADTCVFFTDRMGLLGSYFASKTPVEQDPTKRRGDGY